MATFITKIVPVGKMNELRLLLESVANEISSLISEASFESEMLGKLTFSIYLWSF